MIRDSDKFPLAGKRILIAKPGLDGHDVGAKVVALTLRDAGADVIYTGLRKTPDEIAQIAIDEDVDVVGLSVLSGSHYELTRATAKKLAELGRADIKLLVGGCIPETDIAALRAIGVHEVFSADAPLETMVGRVVDILK